MAAIDDIVSSEVNPGYFFDNITDLLASSAVPATGMKIPRLNPTRWLITPSFADILSSK